MRALLTTISEYGGVKLGAVLHVGAGRCRELERYLRLDPDKIVLVEANPEVADELRFRLRGVEEVEVVNAAVWDAAGQANLHVLNNARESSLFRPEALLRHYPNLEVARTISVPVVTLGKLVERLSLDASSTNLLVLEVQGAELSVLAPGPLEPLQRFSWIAVRASREPLYEGGARLEDVVTALGESGFRPVRHAQVEEAVPFTDVLFKRDAELIRLQALTSQLAEHERTIKSLRRLLDERENEIARMVRERDHQMRLAGEQRAQLEALGGARDEQAKDVAELQSQIDTGTREREAQRALHLKNREWAEELRQQNELLRRERDERVRIAGELQRQVEQLTAIREETAKELAASHQKISQMEQARKELEHRQRLLDAEMVKAEVQIDLIKDVVLREKAF